MRKKWALWLAGWLSFPLLANSIDWYVRDWPPVNILHGAQQGQGAYDLMLAQLMKALPQYQHQIHVSSLTMRQQMMQQDIPHCLFGLLKTPMRQTFMRFSEPVAAIPNLQLFAVRQHPLWRELDGKTQLNVSWLQQARWQGLVEQGRTYPDVLQPLLSRLQQASATEADLAGMLNAGRADYVLEYPDRMHYLARENGGSELRGMPLAGLPAISEVYVACSLNDQSKQQIANINKALKQLRAQPAFRQHLLQWLSADSQKLVGQYMKHSPWFDGIEF